MTKYAPPKPEQMSLVPLEKDEMPADYLTYQSEAEQRLRGYNRVQAKYTKKTGYNLRGKWSKELRQGWHQGHKANAKRRRESLAKRAVQKSGLETDKSKDDLPVSKHPRMDAD